MNYRNYNSLDRCRNDRDQDPEFDDFGFDRRRFGSGRYVRNELDSISIKHDNPDLVQFSNNINSLKRRHEDGCLSDTGNMYDTRLTSSTYKYASCDCSGNCKGLYRRCSLPLLPLLLGNRRPQNRVDNSLLRVVLCGTEVNWSWQGAQNNLYNHYWSIHVFRNALTLGWCVTY